MADSTILVKSPDGWRIKVAFGIFGLAVIVILAFLYRVEVGIITLAIGSAGGARVWVWAIHQHKLAGFERRRLLADVVKAEAEAEAAKARSYFVETNTGVFVLDGIQISQFYPALRVSQPFADGQALLPAPEPRLRRLLDVDFIHMLIVGPSGSGKTTALCWLIDNAPPNTLVFVLDPHAQFNEWPGRTNEVVGIGRDYEAINTKLAALISTMDKRYNGLESTSQKILIVADEWLSIRDKCPNAERFFTDVGGEARKVAMSLVVSSISSTVDDLAVSGAIRDNLAQLGLTLKDQNRGELKWSRKDTELVELPGPYRAAYMPARAIISASHDLGAPEGVTPLGTEPMPVVEEAVEPLPVLDAGPVSPVPDPTELRIYELHQQGKRPHAIWREVYPDKTYGGIQADEIKAVLVKFGVSL